MPRVTTGAEVINKVVAVVNDEIITQQDVDQLLAVLYAQYVNTYSEEELLKKMEGLKKDILRQMIEDKLVLSRAKELALTVTDEEINEKLEEAEKSFPKEKDFYEVLDAQGITVANLKDRYRDQIMMRKVVDLEVRSKVSVLPSEIRKYYEQDSDKFKQDEKYKIRHILIKADDKVSMAMAKVEIERIYDKLKRGDDFAEIAKIYSQGTDRDEGGDKGYIARGEMLDELDEIIFSLKKGEISKPIKSKIGYHIVKVEDIKPARILTLEDVQEDIKKMLFQKKFKERIEEWLDGLSSKAFISIK